MAEELGRAFLLAKLKHLAQDPEPLKQLWEDMRRNRRPPEGFTFEMFRESLMEFEQRFKLSLNPTVRMGLGLLQAKRMFPELLEMTWCLCRAPSDSFFITSDAPVNVFVPRGPKALFGAGYGLEAVEIGFAVSPQVCLYLRRRQGQLRRRASRAFVTEMNRRTACMAERFVFSHLKSRATNTLVTSFSFTRELPKVNREDIERRMRARDKVGEA